MGTSLESATLRWQTGASLPSQASDDWGLNQRSHIGKKFSVRGVSVVEIEGRRIARETDYWDLATLLGQIGLLPTGL
jgi:hypothetical protein